MGQRRSVRWRTGALGIDARLRTGNRPRQVDIDREVEPFLAIVFNVPTMINHPLAPSQMPHWPQTRRNGGCGATPLASHNARRQVVPP
jgi:hypothetical protein